MNTPSTRPVHFNYRQVTSSEQMNELHDQLLQDILSLHNQANQLTKEMGYVKNTLTTENTFLRYRLSDLESKLALLAQRSMENEAHASAHIFPIFPTAMSTESDGHEALVDLETLSVTLKPTKVVSKVNVFDEALQTTYVPQSLKLSYGGATSTIGRQVIQIEDSGPENAFNGDPNSYWVRRHVCDASCRAVYCDLIITLPEDVLTTKNINMIKVNPYPVNAVDIVSIDYKENGNWITIPGFSTHSTSMLEPYDELFDIETTNQNKATIKNAPNLKFNFKGINANEIRIRLRQENYIKLENGQKEMFIGLKSVEIAQCSYHRDYGSFQADVTFPKDQRQITIQDTEILLNNPSEVSNENIQYEYYSYDSLGHLHKISKAAPFTLPNNRLLIKFKILESATTPNIRQVNVHYTLE